MEPVHAKGRPLASTGFHTTMNTDATPNTGFPPPPSAPLDYGTDWTIREALGNGLDGLRRHAKVLLAGALITTGLGQGVSWGLSTAAGQFEGPAHQALMFSHAGSSVLLSALLTAGFIRITLDTARGRTPSLRSFVSSAGSMLGLISVYLLMGVAIYLGSLLLLIPGLMLCVGLSLAPLSVVDRGLGPIEAMQESWHLLDGSKMKLFGLSMLLTLIAAAVLLPLSLLSVLTPSWIVTLAMVVPVTVLSAFAGVTQAWIYLRLLGFAPR